MILHSLHIVPLSKVYIETGLHLMLNSCQPHMVEAMMQAMYTMNQPDMVGMQMNLQRNIHRRCMVCIRMDLRLMSKMFLLDIVAVER